MRKFPQPADQFKSVRQINFGNGFGDKMFRNTAALDLIPTLEKVGSWFPCSSS